MPAGELEDEPGVDRAEDGVARGPDVAEQPLDLGRREVGVDDEPGAGADQLLVPGLAQLVAARRGAPVLPDEGVVDRLAGRAVPGDHGLALVGDPDRVEARRVGAGVGERPRGDPLDALPDLASVVLDPARLREVLRELAVGAPADPALAVEDEAGGTGRPLIDREDHPRGRLSAPRPPRAREVAKLARRGARTRPGSARSPGARARAPPRPPGSRRGRRRSSSRSPSRTRAPNGSAARRTSVRIARWPEIGAPAS